MTRLLIAAALLLAEVTGAVAADTADYVQVVKHEVNLRTGPGTRYALAGSASKGDVFPVLSVQKPWYEITGPDGERVWIYQPLVKPAVLPVKPGHRVVPAHNYANLRTRPTTRSARAGRLKKGEELPVVRRAGDWYEVTLPDETTAWVSGTVVRLLEPDPAGPLLARLRANYPGVIRWGAVNDVVLAHYHEAELDLVVESSWHFLPEEQRLALLREAAAAFEEMLQQSDQYRRRYYNRPLVIVTDPSNTRVGTATPKQARLLNE
jgi:SH3-like domain-containing protein